MAMDVLCGWDLTQKKIQSLCLTFLTAHDVKLAMISPPCTPFSTVQRLNWKQDKIIQEVEPYLTCDVRN